MKKFRYDINALRAIAVISVLLFHLQLPFFSGGFIGVDVFFVISGYLMTKIIFDGLDNNNFSFLNFWGKRVKRIIPALLVMVLAVTVAGYFLYLPSEYKVNENNATSSLMFYSNLLYWKNSGYFDSASDNNILLHTLSLSVEWQFYLIYPLLLWAMSRIFKNKNHILYLIISLTIILCLLSILLTYKSPVASFYLLPTRAWEMLFGGIALLCEKKIAYKNKVLLLVSYLIIFLSIFFFNNKLKWPGIFTLLPVVSTFFILLSNQNSYKILSNSVVQFLGKTSYSLYLWHWPLIVFAQYLGFQLSICNIVSILTPIRFATKLRVVL